MASETKDGRKIQWGIFDWVEWDENSPSQIFEDRLKLLEYADKQNFYCYLVAAHHAAECCPLARHVPLRGGPAYIPNPYGPAGLSAAPI